jgi:hypothetical protein
MQVQILSPRPTKERSTTMSGLYNIIFGRNPLSGPLLASLGFTEISQVGRFRDCFLWREPDSEIVIRVYTRNGGGNREEYMPDFSGHPLFIRDEDDKFDNTYASIFFRVPEEIREQIVLVVAKFGPDCFVDPEKRWAEAMERMKNPNDPETQRVTEAVRPTIEAATRALDCGEPVVAILDSDKT